RLAAFSSRMNLTNGFPGRFPPFPTRLLRPCSTPELLRITQQDSAACIRMVHSLTAGHTDSVGGLLASATAGRPLPMGNGSLILPSAGLGSVSSLGAGLPIITVDGFLTRAVAAGFIHRRWFTDITLAVPSGAPRQGFTLHARSTIP